MKIDLLAKPLSEIKTKALVLTVFEDAKDRKFRNLSPTLNDKLNSMIKSGEISGKYKEFTMIYPEGFKAERVLIMGLGKRLAFSIERLMAVSAVAARNMRRVKIAEMTVENDFGKMGLSAEQGCRAIVEGITLGLYKFVKISEKRQSDYRAIKKLKIALPEETKIKSEMFAAAEKGAILGESTNMARDLVNLPANFLTPESFAQKAREVADESDIKIKVLGKIEIKKERMNALLAVNAGSENPPQLVIMEYNGGEKKGQVLGLVGKGITFDSGGLSLKPSDSMFRMHCDMAGAAAVLAAMECIAKNRLPINVVAVMPLTENLVDSKSYKVGDVIKSREGITVEILNTDAEGRLILADALSFIKDYRSLDHLVDIATLTGAIVTSLGHFCSGAMTNNQEFYQVMARAGENSGEKVWQLPLFDDYMAQLESDIADLENSGGRAAGSVTAALFLKQFVGQIPWIHLDIAGTAWMDETTMPYMKNPFLPKEGGTGVGARLIYHLAELLAE
jgi:leucyl aminopeptidase